MNPTTPLPPEDGWVELDVLGGEHIEDAALRAATMWAGNPNIGVKFLFNGLVIRRPASDCLGERFSAEDVRLAAGLLVDQFRAEDERRRFTGGDGKVSSPDAGPPRSEDLTPEQVARLHDHLRGAIVSSRAAEAEAREPIAKLEQRMGARKVRG